MVLKELLHYDEEANKSFLKEVSYLESILQMKIHRIHSSTFLGN